MKRSKRVSKHSTIRMLYYDKTLKLPSRLLKTLGTKHYPEESVPYFIN